MRGKNKQVHKWMTPLWLMKSNEWKKTFTEFINQPRNYLPQHCFQQEASSKEHRLKVSLCSWLNADRLAGRGDGSECSPRGGNTFTITLHTEVSPTCSSDSEGIRMACRMWWNRLKVWHFLWKASLYKLFFPLCKNPTYLWNGHRNDPATIYPSIFVVLGYAGSSFNDDEPAAKIK